MEVKVSKDGYIWFTAIKEEMILECRIVSAVCDVEDRCHLSGCVRFHLLEEGLEVDALKKAIRQRLNPKPIHLGLPELDLGHRARVQPLVQIFCGILTQHLLRLKVDKYCIFPCS